MGLGVSQARVTWEGKCERQPAKKQVCKVSVEELPKDLKIKPIVNKQLTVQRKSSTLWKLNLYLFLTDSEMREISEDWLSAAIYMHLNLCMKIPEIIIRNLVFF